jgi:hypothetical protein
MQVESWKSSLDLYMLANTRTWKVEASRCGLCHIGYIRDPQSIVKYKEDEKHFIAQSIEYIRIIANQSSAGFEEVDRYLCYACVIRKELHQKISVALPRMLRKSFPSVWPVLSAQYCKDNISTEETEKNFKDQNDMLAKDYESLCITVSKKYRKELMSPLASAKLEELDFLEAQRISSSRDGSERANSPISSPSGSPSKSIDSKAPNTPTDISILSNDDFPVESQATFDSISTHSFFAPTDRPKELQLLAFLLFKELYEDAERMIRIVMNKYSINEGEGLYFTYQLFCMQADMYKSMGLHILAVSVYVDLVDLTSVLVGISNGITQKAIRFLLSNYFKFHMVDEARTYYDKVVDKVNQELRSDLIRNDVLTVLKQTKR